MDINMIQYNLRKLYYENLVSQMKKNKIDTEYLVNIINNMNTSEIENNIQTELKSDITIQSELKSDIAIQSEINIRSEDEYLYRKPWNKLNNIHKMIKIKEFVNNLHITNENEKTELKNNLIKMIKEKKLSKKNSVEYDETNGRIVSIPNLQVKNNIYIVV